MMRIRNEDISFGLKCQCNKSVVHFHDSCAIFLFAITLYFSVSFYYYNTCNPNKFIIIRYLSLD